MPIYVLLIQRRGLCSAEMNECDIGCIYKYFSRLSAEFPQLKRNMLIFKSDMACYKLTV